MKIKSTFIILLMFSIFLSCSQQTKIDRLIFKGMDYFQQGDIISALAEFEKIIKLDEKNADAYEKKADCLDLLGNVEGSIEYYTKAIEIDSTKKNAFYNRALSFEKLGKIDNVISDYITAINTDPDNKSELNNKLIYLNLGIVYGQQYRLDNAIEAFSKAIEIDSLYADAFFNRGYAYLLQGKRDKAIENFDKATSIQPENKDYVTAIEQMIK